MSPSPIIFETICWFSLNSAGKPCHWKWPQHYIFNPIASVNPKWQTKLLSWMQNLHESKWNHEGLVIMVTTSLSCDSWTHSCATVGPIVGPSFEPQ
jgi:hypothetical protein